MIRTSTLLLIIALLVITAHRLPAPIHEPDEKTSTSEETPKPTKHSKSKNDEDSKKSEAKATPRPSGKARNLDGPKPIYPPEAVGLHLTGTGKYLLQFDQATGRVTDVTVSQSAGSPILDNAAISAFRQWHEDPQCAKEVTMTMTFGPPPVAPEE